MQLKKLIISKWMIFGIGVFIGFVFTFLYLNNINQVRNEQAADYIENRMRTPINAIDDWMTLDRAKFQYFKYSFISRYMLEREVNLMCGQNYVETNQTDMDKKLWVKFDETMEQCMRCE